VSIGCDGHPATSLTTIITAPTYWQRKGVYTYVKLSPHVGYYEKKFTAKKTRGKKRIAEETSRIKPSGAIGWS
jgi:hypothetical protein